MSAPANTLSSHANSQMPPRERILVASGDLFYRLGIRAVGVEAIAEAAGTNKMTLYRHFSSKDELVAEYLRRLAGDAGKFWDELAAAHPGDPRAQLTGWLQAMEAHLLDTDQRGCALANAAIELPEKNHPAKCVIEQFKIEQRERLIALCAADRPRGARDARRRTLPAARRRAGERAERRPARPRLTLRAHGRGADRGACGVVFPLILRRPRAAVSKDGGNSALWPSFETRSLRSRSSG